MEITLSKLNGVDRYYVWVPTHQKWYGFDRCKLACELQPTYIGLCDHEEVTIHCELPQ